MYSCESFACSKSSIRHVAYSIGPSVGGVGIDVDVGNANDDRADDEDEALTDDFIRKEEDSIDSTICDWSVILLPEDDARPFGDADAGAASQYKDIQDGVIDSTKSSTEDNTKKKKRRHMIAAFGLIG